MSSASADARGAGMINWDVAVATARRLSRPGPQVTFEQASTVVGDLRRLTDEASAHVQLVTRLTPAAGAGHEVAVVDRTGWVQANVEGFRLVVAPLLETLAERRGEGAGSNLVAAAGARVTGVQLGTVLAYLAGKVLGQYEIFLPEGVGHGRLTLVAPNILATERTLRADPRDFRLWVCLHEVAHRTQFTAVPWMHAHVHAEVQALLAASDLDPAVLRERLRAAAGAVGRVVRGTSEESLVEMLQTPAQRAVLDRITALMTLLEGHAEYVMDGVGPDVLPSVAQLRQRFSARRAGAGPVDRVLRRLFGLDVKLRQYAEGSRFVRAVVADVGVDRFNEVWTTPSTLPTKAEIADHRRWMARVLGERPAVSA